MVGRIVEANRIIVSTGSYLVGLPPSSRRIVKIFRSRIIIDVLKVTNSRSPPLYHSTLSPLSSPCYLHSAASPTLSPAVPVAGTSVPVAPHAPDSPYHVGTILLMRKRRVRAK